MGCGDSCPIYPAKRYVDWELPDPAGKQIEDVRSIRDEIERRVRALVGELVGSTGTCVMCFHASCNTICAASGSQRMLNSRRGVLAYSVAKALPAAVGL